MRLFSAVTLGGRAGATCVALSRRRVLALVTSQGSGNGGNGGWSPPAKFLVAHATRRQYRTCVGGA
eukprot:1941716-Rhodomonas_salina.1